MGVVEFAGVMRTCLVTLRKSQNFTYFNTFRKSHNFSYFNMKFSGGLFFENFLQKSAWEFSKSQRFTQFWDMNMNL